MDAAETGRKGEAVAARYYQQRGCLLLAHDYRTRMGEIDLSLREPDGTIVLCEVKTRSPDPLASPASFLKTSATAPLKASASMENCSSAMLFSSFSHLMKFICVSSTQKFY